ncbi:MAG TPA: hypothetical protein EYP63_08280 [Desulfotomaculum sp.]|nr:hypothetical protein [Desulfotomaculum sp.]
MSAFYFQLKSFGWSLVVGALGGGLYDLLRVSFSLLKWRSRGRAALGDVLFWLCFTSLACCLILAVSGELRFYTFLGMAAGFLLYNRFLRRRVVAFETRTGEALLRLLRFLKRVIVIPFNPLRNWLHVWQRRKTRR